MSHKTFSKHEFCSVCKCLSFIKWKNMLIGWQILIYISLTDYFLEFRKYFGEMIPLHNTILCYQMDNDKMLVEKVYFLRSIFVIFPGKLCSRWAGVCEFAADFNWNLWFCVTESRRLWMWHIRNTTYDKAWNGHLLFWKIFNWLWKCMYMCIS